MSERLEVLTNLELLDRLEALAGHLAEELSLMGEPTAMDALRIELFARELGRRLSARD